MNVIGQVTFRASKQETKQRLSSAKWS